MNRTLVEMARAMLHDHDVPAVLRASAEVSTSHPLDADDDSSITENHNASITEVHDGINSATLDNHDEEPKDFVVTVLVTDHITINTIKFKYYKGDLCRIC